MKIGILTFHCAHNYGAVLQCFALQKTLAAMGHDVEVIDYRPEFLLAPSRIFSFNRRRDRNPLIWAKHLVEEIILAPLRKRRSKAFKNFIGEHLCLSDEICGQNIPDTYDVYIIGSDQVWNPKLTGGRFDPVYLADFSFVKGGRKYVSYAASTGTLEFEGDRDNGYLFDCLAKFDSVSVREPQLSAYLRNNVKIDVDTVLDPTLLASPEIWDDIATEPEVSGKYVLLYQVQKNRDAVRIAEDMARQIGGKVVELSSWVSPRFSNRKKQYASPSEFLGLMKYADCVVTTSFHGTAFSIVFRRSFYFLRVGTRSDVRSESLLQSLGLECRIIDSDSDAGFESLDYSAAEQVLADQRKFSNEYLIDSLWIR